VEEQLASLTDLLEEALRTDSVSDVTSYDNSADSLNVPPRPAYLYSEKSKMRTASDSGTESLISEICGHSSIGMYSIKNNLSFQKRQEGKKLRDEVALNTNEKLRGFVTPSKT
jgi:hypothetical protein